MDNSVFDIVIIGGGPGGYTAAIHAAKLGMTIALVEMDKLGGTCLNRGCIPTAAMLHSGESFRRMKESEQYGIYAQNVSLDYERLLGYRDETVRYLIRGVEQRLEQERIKCFSGKGTLLAGNVVRVESAAGCTELTAENVILATGSTARIPDIPGISLPGVADSDGALAWRTLPESLTVIGGGVIGVEYAQIFSDLGSRVTLLGTRERLLPSMDKEVSQRLRMVMKKRGMDIHTGVNVAKIEQIEGILRCTYVEKGVEQTADTSHVLYAVGRVPNTNGLFEGIRPLMVEGRLVVDSRYQTNLKDVYAIGDVIGGAQTAHLATAQGMAVVERIAGRTPSMDTNVVPICVYTDPEIASVGLTERQAQERGIHVKTRKSILGRNGRFAVTRGEQGVIRVLASADTGEILGAHLMCARAGDMIGELVSAVSNHFTVEQLLRAIRPHPTYNEALVDVLSQLL